MNRVIRLYYVLPLLFCWLWLGCAGTPRPAAQVLVADYNQKKPKTIAVLPVEDARLKKDKVPNLEKKLVNALKYRKYEAQEADRTAEMLRQANITPASAQSGDPKEIFRILGVDAILKYRLDDYESSYRGLYRTDRIEMHFKLIDCKTGDLLWEDHFAKHESYIGGLVDVAISNPMTGWVEDFSLMNLPTYDGSAPSILPSMFRLPGM